MSNFKIKQFFNDLRSFHAFKKDVRRELDNPDSIFNKFGIKKNWLGNIIYMQVDCTEEDFINSNYEYDSMIANKIKPVVKYLSRTLGWSDYLIPQISNFVDEEGNPSLSFGVLFIFKGYSLTLVRGILFYLMILILIIASIIYGLTLIH